MTTRAYDRARSAAGSISLDSPFAGVPVLMKDMIDVGGMRRTDGSKLLAANVPQSNVSYVGKLHHDGQCSFWCHPKPLGPGLLDIYFQWRIRRGGISGRSANGTRYGRGRFLSLARIYHRHSRHEAQPSANVVRRS
jgi:hypothetical protein